jgi:hypothetical protein
MISGGPPAGAQAAAFAAVLRTRSKPAGCGGASIGIVGVMGQEEIWDVDAAQVYDTSGAGIPAVVGDMATAGAPGKYTLVYLVYNTISNLLTQAEQVACFRNAALHWGSGRTPGG